MRCRNIEKGQLIQPGEYGVGWSGHKIVPREGMRVGEGAIPGRGIGTDEGIPVLGSVDLWGTSRCVGHMI